MIRNRSVPRASVVPVLAYPDVDEAAEWLCRVFGFRERLRIGTHRAQLVHGDGAVIVTERVTTGAALGRYEGDHSVHVRVDDARAHYARAARHGAHILQPPTDYEYGERQYVAEDPGGHRWTFSESIDDVDPESWGATMPEPEPPDASA